MKIEKKKPDYSRFNICCAGEAMIEFSGLSGGEGPFLSVAGDTLNTAVYLKRMTLTILEVHMKGTDQE